MPMQAGAATPDAAITLPTLRPSVVPSFTFQAPRSHPPGTLLVDHLGDLWMVDNWLERRLVSGDDVLGEIDLGNENAIPMSEIEERCLIPVDDEYWYPASTGWYPYYSPVSDDALPGDGLWLLNPERLIRRPVKMDQTKSWGYGPWINDFTEGDGDWSSYRAVRGPLGFRDGSIFITEFGEYFYMIKNLAWNINPELAESVGYKLEDAILTTSTRLFHQTTRAGELTSEVFNSCPAQEPISQGIDHDHDGSPSYRDCDDHFPSYSPLNPEICNGLDDNCDGLTDDIEACLGTTP